jgi:hypothetical protein
MTATVAASRWGLAIAAGVVAEIGVFAVMPVALAFGPDAPLYAIPPAAFLMPFLVSLWVTRRVGSHRILHGALIGAVAAVIYIAITIGQTLPIAYVVSHFLKVLGGMTGGFIVDRRLRGRGKVQTVAN